MNKFDMIAVMVKDDPVLYVSPINWWFEDYVQPRAVGHDYSLRGGSSQKRVFLYRFARVQPESLGIIVSP